MPMTRKLQKSPRHRDELVGQAIKGFKIIQFLGRGGMGDVWMAEQPLVKTRVAIKLLDEGASGDKQQVQRFFNEAIAAGRIKHSGVVKIFDVGFHAGRAFLIMEFLEGETLTARLRRGGRLSVGDVAEIGRQIVSILEATHAENIIHRDLKPDNVFLVHDTELDSKLRVKILDFGIAKLGTGMTGTGESMGTPGYMAPEQWTHAADADALTDVYSLGCLIFELCCGRLPFVTKSIPMAYAQQMNDVPPRASSLIPDLPSELDDLLVRMLARSSKDRPAVCDVREAFARLVLSPPRGPDYFAMKLDLLAAATTVSIIGRAKKIKRAVLSRKALITAISVLVAGCGLLVTVRQDYFIESSDKATIKVPVLDMVPLEIPAKTPAPAKVPAEVPEERATKVPIKTPVETTIITPTRTKILKKEIAKSTKSPIEAPLKPHVCPTAMVIIPAGVFEMGNPIGTGQANEHPQHTVTLSSYCIDKTEVTVSSYERCVREKGCLISPPTRNLLNGQEATVWAPYCNREDHPDHPINCVDWYQAETYCHWIGKRLPTEAEWEYAARGNDGRLYPWGNALPNSKRLNACGGECVEMGQRELDDRLRPQHALYPDSDGHETTAPVGSYPGDASPFGVLDLGGNVSEWIADWYGQYSPGSEVSPNGPISGTMRLTRGGNWFFGIEGLVRATTRIPDDPNQRRVRLGFRCARDLVSGSTH
jgi:formylglycine-generating enzyme required for sulfatase activity/tRNA A-37 threonylcarbamoyl transferase component Bud32